MRQIQRQLPAYRAVWNATGVWGPLWVGCVVLAVVVQVAVNNQPTTTPEFRQYVNLVFTVLTLGCMYAVMSRIRQWQQAQNTPVTPERNPITDNNTPNPPEAKNPNP